MPPMSRSSSQAEWGLGSAWDGSSGQVGSPFLFGSPGYSPPAREQAWGGRPHMPTSAILGCTQLLCSLAGTRQELPLPLGQGTLAAAIGQWGMGGEGDVSLCMEEKDGVGDGILTLFRT